MTRQKLMSWLAWMTAAFVMIVGCSSMTPPDSESNTSASPETAIALTVSAAASMQDAMKAIQPIYEDAHPGITLIYNFSSSGSLQQQIEQGAPVDVFLSASPRQMNTLEEKGLLLEGSRRDLLKNSIVLVTPLDKNDVATFEDLDNDIVRNLSIGEPDSVPAGQYSKETLESLGLYESVQPKIVFAKDVRQVLSYVETGNVDAGLVYSTDAKVSDQVQIVATAPDDSHSPIAYPAAVIADSSNPEAAIAFVDFLSTDEAIALFTDYGFLSAI